MNKKNMNDDININEEIDPEKAIKAEMVTEERAAAQPLTVAYEGEAYKADAEALAAHIGAPCARIPKKAPCARMAESAPAARGLTLLLNDSGLSLTDGRLSLRADLADMLPRLRQNNLEREFLVKAARIKGLKAADGPLRAVDATAGLGEDSLLLAAAGYEVELYEYDPVIAALLRDALRRASESEHDALREAAGRMRLNEGDSVSAMKSMEAAKGSPRQPDIILLDPMFPERQKSALVKKKFQLLQQLESPCAGADESELIYAAEAAGPRRIIIKRPLKGTYLAGRRPSYSITGKAVRYDCIVIPR